MADAAISFAVEKLGDALINKVSFLIGVEDQVRWLKDELQSMQCFLKDAAEKQGNNEHGNLIRKWISDVREVAQDAEDVIEIFTLKVDAPTRKRDLVRKWAGFPAHVSHLNMVGKEIESIRTRLDEISKRRERYGIRNLGEVGTESSSTRRSEMVELRRRMATRLQKDKDVVGLNEDADLLLNKVILDDKRKELSFAVIVGMGGIGKSTLARKIFNHPAIPARFNKRAWVVVSSEFALEDILKQIMHELSDPLDAEELKTLESIQGKLRRQEMLQQMLCKRLEGKRYFIVLDDVWENAHWEILKNAFPVEQDKASRLVLTSRNQIMTGHRAYVHKMKLLNPEESWELFLKTALIGRRCPLELEELGREMLKKCHGLPLAITVAGGLLVNEGEYKSGWEKVLKQIKNYRSETSEVGTSVSAILELSYQNLPSQLKPCFLSLAFFKEDEVIRVRRLVHIWVVLGLVQAGEESVEETARSYLDELINRNLILVKEMTIDEAVKDCYVHDLLRELSIWKAKEEIGFESLINEDHERSSSSSSSSSSSKPRHRVVQGVKERLIRMETSNQKKHIRSLFLQVKNLKYGDAYFSTPSYWKGFELLRILDIEGSRLVSLPTTIGALIRLRYLRLREKNGVLRLPRWLDVLKNLEILDIGCDDGVKFPDVTWKMDHLRHFYIDSIHCSTFSASMKKSSWKNLETLKYVRLDNVLQGFSYRLRKLGVELREEGVPEFERFLVESQVEVLHLRALILRIIPDLSSLVHLTKLKLDGYMIGCLGADMFPQSITHLTLSQSHISKNDPMKELGKLPNLLYLKLDDALSNTRWTIKVSHEGFPSLRVLHLRNLDCLEFIHIEKDGMPHLQRLEIYRCPNLENILYLQERISPAETIIVAH